MSVNWSDHNAVIFRELGETMEYRPVAGPSIPDARVIPEFDVEIYGDSGAIVDMMTFFNVQYPDIQPRRGEFFRYNGEDYEVLKISDVNDETRRRVPVKKVISNG